MVVRLEVKTSPAFVLHPHSLACALIVTPVHDLVIVIVAVSIAVAIAIVVFVTVMLVSGVVSPASGNTAVLTDTKINSQR